MALFLAMTGAPAAASGLTGTWTLSVDLENGEHGEPALVIQQSNDQLSGAYRGPFGKQKVTGSVQGDTVVLEVAASGLGRTLRLSYTGHIEASDRISGTMIRNISGTRTAGKWTATRDR